MDIKAYLESNLKKRLAPSIFLHKMRVADDSVRNSFSYNEPTYIPLYYWLGTILKPTVLVEVGFRLGLLSSVFLKSCKTVKHFLALQEPHGEFYSSRMGISNVKDNYKNRVEVYTGNAEDEFFITKLKVLSIDLAIVNEETSYDKYRHYFDMLHERMSSEGMIVVDCIKKYKSLDTAIKDFCVSSHLEATYINTTYGACLIRKG